MKRINPTTGKIFKQGDICQDGKIFVHYEFILNKEGYFRERKKTIENYKTYLKKRSEKDKKKREKIEKIIIKIMIGDQTWLNDLPQKTKKNIEKIGIVKHNGCKKCGSKDIKQIHFEHSHKDFFRTSWVQFEIIYKKIIIKDNIYCNKHNKKRENMGRDSQKTGDINEHKAIIKFLKEGYYVFNNVSRKGPIDMVLVHEKTGEIRKIDVKTNSYRQSYKPTTRRIRTPSKEQIKLGVEYEYIDKDEDD
jgi:hypothetical protein